MRKKLTITLDEQVYKALYEAVGPRHVSRFIEDLIRPCIMFPNLEAAYAQMAQDKEREAEALAWAETMGDIISCGER